jgi:2-oxoglutarate/2-oxoacid ferredoxin oxidoreductase subunit alpha
LMPVAFNLAEQYQISVIVLTDKQIAEALYTQHPYDPERAEIDRGRLVVDPEKLKLLKSSDRFDPHAKGGVSLRWLPGSDTATYCAQGDEHNSVGAVDESSLNTRLQMEKRLRKFDGLKARLPAPHLSIGGRSVKTSDWIDLSDEIELLAIGWGSTGEVFQDVMCSDELRGRKIAYLHYTYLWPLRTEELRRLAMRSKRIVLVEQNYQGQLGMLIRMECGLDIRDKILKYDGRPFFYDELLSSVIDRCGSTSENETNPPGFDYAGASS